MVRQDRGWAKDAETSWQRFLDWGKGSARSIAAEIKAALLHSGRCEGGYRPKHGSPMGVYETFPHRSIEEFTRSARLGH